MQDNEYVLQRLQKLEAQNRRFKIAGAFALILFASFSVMGQTVKRRIYQAERFEILDSSGKRIAYFGLAPDIADIDKSEVELVLGDTEQKAMCTIINRGTIILKERGLYLEGKHLGMFPGGITLNDGQSNEHVDLDTSRISMAKSDTHSLTIYPNHLHIIGPDQGYSWLSASDFSLKDADFSISLGEADLITPKAGDANEKSAPSIVMFDKDKKVIWKAP